MHLFTSSSEPEITVTEQAGRYRLAARVFIGIILIVLLMLELGTRFLLHRISRIEHRIESEHTWARAIRSTPQRPAVLMVGNSLLLEGVDYPALRRELDHHADVVRFVMEDTRYFDWYYGIRRLLVEGSRPDTIVLCLNMPQLLNSSTHGDMASYHLFAAADLVSVSHNVHYNLTETSGLGGHPKPANDGHLKTGQWRAC